MKMLLLIGVLVVTLLVVNPCLGGIPQTINYQGMLTYYAGSPLTDKVNIVFKIYDPSSAGNLKWQENQSDVPVINGLFNVILGNANLIDSLSFNQNYWLGIMDVSNSKVDDLC